MALQMRYLQTLVECASENNSTTIFPIPIDLMTPFIQAAKEMLADKEKSLPSSTGAPVPTTDRERQHS